MTPLDLRADIPALEEVIYLNTGASGRVHVESSRPRRRSSNTTNSKRPLPKACTRPHPIPMMTSEQLSLNFSVPIPAKSP